MRHECLPDTLGSCPELHQDFSSDILFVCDQCEEQESRREVGTLFPLPERIRAVDRAHCGGREGNVARRDGLIARRDERLRATRARSASMDMDSSTDRGTSPLHLPSGPTLPSSWMARHRRNGQARDSGAVGL